MADVKINQLPNKTTLVNTDVIIVESATQTQKMTVGKFKELLGIQGGGIVESGSNTNGNYVKFGDGTMICYTLLILVYQTPDYLSLSGNTPWTYPEAFVGTPAALATKSEAWVSSSLIRSTVATSPSSSTCRVRLYAAEGNPFVSGNSYQVSIAVIGRWK